MSAFGAGFGKSMSAAPEDWTGVPALDPSAQRPRARTPNTFGNMQRGPMQGGMAGNRGGGAWDGNYLGRYGTHQVGSNIDAGSRTMGSVNWGAFAGSMNALNNQTGPLRDQTAAYMRANGLMGSYNGVALDQLNGPQRQWQSAGGSMQRQQQMQNTGKGMGDEMPGRPAMSGGSPMYAQPQQQMPGLFPGGMGGGMAPGAGGGASGSMGFPLEGRLSGAITGMLDNPSGLSAQQTAMLRNRNTDGVLQQRNMAQQTAREEGARRGLNPAEIEANLGAIGSRYDAQQSRSLMDFELGQAQAAQAGRLGGIQAGLGLQGQQLSNEDSIRRYLAMMASASAGQAPMFLNV